MKNLFFLVLCSVTLQASAQITFEHNYPNANNFSGIATPIDVEFGITFLDDTTSVYYHIEYDSSRITLYNMNHSLYLIINIPVTYSNNLYQILYITKTLFDCDPSDIEYLLNFHNSISGIYYVRIYDENGIQLFNANNALNNQCIGCVGNLFMNIVNTPVGTKMRLGFTDYSVSIYSLCGTLPAGFTSPMNNSFNAFELSGNYPNPANDFTIINYSLPQGERTGEIIFFDMYGSEVKRFAVDRMFNHLRISTSDLPAGTYIYTLQTSKGISGSRKMIKID